MSKIYNSIQKFSEIILTSRVEDSRAVLSKYMDGKTFAHFSDLEGRFGFNPKYSWNTPFGIYGYVINEFLLNKFYELFATNRKYIHIFRAKAGSNILDISNLSRDEYDIILNKIRKLFPHRERVIQYAMKKAREPTFSSEIWNITRLLGENAKQWTKVLQRLGYDGVVDYGSEIIHENEPYQTVIFVGNEELITIIENKTKDNLNYNEIFNDMRKAFEYIYSLIKSKLETNIIENKDIMRMMSHPYLNYPSLNLRTHRMFSNLAKEYTHKIINNKDLNKKDLDNYIDIIKNIIHSSDLSASFASDILFDVIYIAKSFEKKSNKINTNIKIAKNNNTQLLLSELASNGYNTKVINEKAAYKWLYDVMPNVVHSQLVEPKELKKCGTMSNFIAGLAAKNGIAAGIVNEPGHFVLYIPLDNGKALRVDSTHLQFKFPYHGGLKDFARDERDSEDYIKMKQLFSDLYNNPMMAVKIEKVDNIPEMRSPPELSMFFNPSVRVNKEPYE